MPLVCVHVNTYRACQKLYAGLNVTKSTAAPVRAALVLVAAVIMIKRLKHTHSCEHLCPLTLCSTT